MPTAMLVTAFDDCWKSMAAHDPELPSGSSVVPDQVPPERTENRAPPHSAPATALPPGDTASCARNESQRVPSVVLATGSAEPADQVRAVCLPASKSTIVTCPVPSMPT